MVCILLCDGEDAVPPFDVFSHLGTLPKLAMLFQSWEACIARSELGSGGLGLLARRSAALEQFCRSPGKSRITGQSAACQEGK
jgi:hypothetical protein